MSLNFEANGHSLAILKDGAKSKVVYVAEKKEDVYNKLDDIKATGNQSFQLIPNITKERNIVYIAGASGSGKSFFAKEYISKYRELHPKRDIFVFSSLGEDSTLDKIKVLKRIKIDEALLEADLSAKDFENSLVIFDDSDCITNKPLKLKVKAIMDNLLQTGRHFNVDLIITSHILCGGNETKLVLNEAHSITIFPQGLGGRSLKYLLDQYLGLDKHQIKRIKQLNSRAITICKTYPMCVVSEKEIYILNKKD